MVFVVVSTYNEGIMPSEYLTTKYIFFKSSHNKDHHTFYLIKN